LFSPPGLLYTDRVSATRVLSGDEPLRLALQGFRLVMLRGPAPGRVYELGAGETRLGKGPDNDVVIPDATVSRAHCVVVRDGAAYLLRDLGSTNGTFIEDERIREAFLRPGVRLRVGEVLLKFQPVAEVVEVAPSGRDRLGALVGHSARMREIFTLLERIAPTDATVLLTGETGTGKGAVARAVHELGARAGKPFVTIDCGAVSRSLIESELFGHERGAFTGATHTRKGALELASGGTLFIDELDDLPLELQPKLLRALEEREIQRLGTNTQIKLDVRVIAATKKDLRAEVAAGRFREDLYFRLSVVLVPLPPLRERKEDLGALVDHFLGQPGAWDHLAKATRERLAAHTWPGNVRELRNVIERASYVGGFDALDLSALRADRGGDDAERLRCDYARPFKDAKNELIERFEREYIRRLLERTGGNMARAAREAGIDRKYMYLLMKKHGMEPGEVPPEE
jgi:DNA-binding NtrC family response regulator